MLRSLLLSIRTTIQAGIPQVDLLHNNILFRYGSCVRIKTSGLDNELKVRVAHLLLSGGNQRWLFVQNMACSEMSIKTVVR